jgi:uncharacterized protein (DUF697 family)
MSRKRLPRAIMRTGEDASAALAQRVSDAPIAQGSAVAQHRAPHERAETVKIIEMRAAHADAERPEARLARRAVAADARRRARALAIVSRYAAGSALSGMMPLPLVTFAGVSAVTVRMVKSLSDHYGVPFEEDRARAIVVALVGGALPTGVGVVTASALSYLWPPAAVIGVAASAMSAAAYTRGVGRIFIEHFESGATLQDFSSQVMPASSHAA